MNPASLVLIVLVIALGGFVANLADRFGRKIGKKKLMIGKLRPKHTAQLLTTLSGMMIAIIVVSFYFLFSKEARDWAIEGQNIRKQRDGLLGQVGDLEKQKATISIEKDQLESEKKRLTGAKTGLELQIINLAKEARENNKKLAESAQRLTELRKRQETLKSQRDKLEKQRNSIQIDLKNGKIDLQKAQSDLKTNEDGLKKIKSDYNATIDEINSIQEKNDQLVRENSQLERDRKAAQDEKKRAEDAAQDRLAELDRQIKSRQDQLEQSKIALKLFEGATNYYARAQLVFSRGDELVRREVPPLLSPNQAEAMYESALIEASRVAEQKGSRSKGDYPVVTLVPVKNPTTGQDVTPAEQQREVILRLANSETSQVLIFRAGFNAFQGDPVIALIEVSPNPVVFRAGQNLADIRVNGRLTDEEVFNQVSTFLRTEVSDRVRRAGMIPRSNVDSSVGEVSALDLLKVVQEVRTRNAQVTVYALADDVTRASGPLKIRFRVR